MHKNIIPLFLLAILFLIGTASAVSVNYWPASNSISTSHANHITDGHNDQVLFATSLGICIFEDGKWTKLKALPKDKTGYRDGIPYSNFVTALEYDTAGNLWVGCTNGLQIYDGFTKPITFTDNDKHLPSYHIRSLCALGDQMWIAIGNCGLFCYQNGEWKWFSPASLGLPSPTVFEMAVDYSAGALFTASDDVVVHQTSWLVNQIKFNPDGSAYAQEVHGPSITADMNHIRSDMKGGIYLFSRTNIAHYSASTGESEHVLNIRDLSGEVTRINDVASAHDGQLVIATNNGVYGYKDGKVTKHLDKSYTILSEIKRVYVDINNRWWYSNNEVIGYYMDETAEKTVTAVELHN